MTDAPKTSVPPLPTSRSLPIALLRAREAIMSKIRPVLARHDISVQQWRVLRVLNEVRFLEASEVAERAAILAPSLTRIIKTLEGRQLIRSGRFDKDGRKLLLAITPSGVALIEEVLPTSMQLYDEIDRLWGREKVEQLLNLLEALIALEPALKVPSEPAAPRRVKRRTPTRN